MARAALAKLTIDENAPTIRGKLAQLSLNDRQVDPDSGKPSLFSTSTNSGADLKNIQTKSDNLLELLKKPFGNATSIQNRQNLSTAPTNHGTHDLSKLTNAHARNRQDSLNTLQGPLKTHQELPKPPQDLHKPTTQAQLSEQAKQPIKVSHQLQQSLVSKIPRLRRTTSSNLPQKSPLIEEEVEDIDKADDRDAIYQVTDFIKDIYAYLRHLETVQSISPNFLKNQTVLTPKVRSRLVNWCIGVHASLDLLPETLYLSIAIMDRYFQIERVEQQQVQLVGVTAIFIASKYEEIYAPDIDDFVVICNREYKKRDIIKTEILILKKLNFDLGRPLPLSFLRRFSKAAHSDVKMHTLAKFLMELSLTEYECAHWKPSLLAATASYLAIRLFDRGPWSRTMVYYTSYTETQLKPYASTMCKIIKKALKLGNQSTCVKKYSSSSSMKVPQWPQLQSPLVDEIASSCA